MVTDLRDPRYYMRRSVESVNTALREMQGTGASKDVVFDNLDMSIKLLVLAKAELEIEHGT